LPCPSRRLQWGGELSLQLGGGATIEGPSLLVRARRIRILLPVADRLDARGRDALCDQILTRGVRASLAERQVVLARAALVAVAGDGDRIVGVLLEPLGLATEGLAAVLADGRHVGVEVDPVTHVLGEVGGRARRDSGRRGRRCRRLLAAAAAACQERKC